MSEKELVKRAKNGDFEAFSQLITDQKDKIYRLALKLTGNREDAEDIMQDTFIKAIDNIDRFRGESSFGTWLYSIALNNIRAKMGRQSRVNLKSIEEYLPAGHANESQHDELFEWGDPHELLERQQIQEIIEEGLSEMELKYSTPFVLRYMEDLPVKEVAKVMNLTLAATKSRILRARLALREKLSAALEEKKRERV